MNPKTILIIDDDQTLVAPLKDGLESIGYRVAVAFDGVQGIYQALQSRPDAIILDFNMPGGGGENVYKRLRKSPQTTETPVIFSTVVALEEVKSRISPTPNTYFLRKPVGLSQFIGVLNKVLGHPAPVEVREPFMAVPPPVSAPKAQPAGREKSRARPAPKPAREGGKLEKYHEFEVRVTYADTDKMGVIYYSNYLRYFEAGRTELFRSMGVRYRDLEVQRKLFIPCVEANCQYLAPARYDDLLVVRSWIASVGRASIVFRNTVYNKDLGGKTVAEGFTRHALVNDLWRSVRIPPDLRKLMDPYIQKG